MRILSQFELMIIDQIAIKVIVVITLNIFTPPLMSQNLDEIGLYEFFIWNSPVIDTVTGVQIDQVSVFNLFVQDYMGDNHSHYDGIVVDTYTKIADGYNRYYSNERKLLRTIIDDVGKPGNERNFNIQYHYYQEVYNEKLNSKDTVYVFSRPKYISDADAKLYEYSLLRNGSYRLSNVRVKGKNQVLSDCYKNQKIEVLPKSYFVMHYGDNYKIKCIDSLMNIHRNVLKVETTDDVVRFFTQGTSEYLLAGNYIYLFTHDHKVISQLGINTTETGFTLTYEDGTKYEYSFIMTNVTT
jgi:hypothetical protein